MAGCFCCCSFVFLFVFYLHSVSKEHLAAFMVKWSLRGECPTARKFKLYFLLCLFTACDEWGALPLIVTALSWNKKTLVWYWLLLFSLKCFCSSCFSGTCLSIECLGLLSFPGHFSSECSLTHFCSEQENQSLWKCKSSSSQHFFFFNNHGFYKI